MALAENLQKLKKDCDIETYRASGPGGQHRNKTESAVRVTHRPTGITRVATEHRSQLRNRELALERVWKAIQARRRKPKPRIATKPTAAAAARRLTEKHEASEKKSSRRKPLPED